MDDVAKAYDAYGYEPSGNLTDAKALDYLLNVKVAHVRPYATTQDISGCIFCELGRPYRKEGATAQDKWRTGGGVVQKSFVQELQQTLRHGRGVVTQSTGVRYQFHYYQLRNDDPEDHMPKPVLYLVGTKVTRSIATGATLRDTSAPKRECPTPTPSELPEPPSDEEVVGLPLPATTKKPRTMLTRAASAPANVVTVLRPKVTRGIYPLGAAAAATPGGPKSDSSDDDAPEDEYLYDWKPFGEDLD